MSVLDAFFSPFIGYISDHFHHTKLGRRFGRRRFFILLAIPLLPSFALMWIEGQTFWYYLVTYVFFELVYAMEIIPYETLAAEMSPNYATRSRHTCSRRAYSQESRCTCCPRSSNRGRSGTQTSRRRASH